MSSRPVPGRPGASVAGDPQAALFPRSAKRGHGEVGSGERERGRQAGRRDRGEIRHSSSSSTSDAEFMQ